MKRTAHDHENRNEIGSNRVGKDEQESSSSKSEAGTVAALHKAVGNQVVQRKRGNDQTEVPTDTGRWDHLFRQRNIARNYSHDQGSDTNVPDVVRSVISSPGRWLDEMVQREMEAKMGGDFDNVKIHTGSKAAAAADSINARAFTVGNHVTFNRGEYQPRSLEGKRILAHELTHVRQQRESVTSSLGTDGISDTNVENQQGLEINSPDDPAEKEAEQVAQKVTETDKIDSDSKRRDTKIQNEASTSSGSGIGFTRTSERTDSPNINRTSQIKQTIQRQEKMEEQVEKGAESVSPEIPSSPYENPRTIVPPEKLGSEHFAIRTKKNKWLIVIPENSEKSTEPEDNKDVKKRGTSGENKKPQRSPYFISESEANKKRQEQLETIRNLLPTIGIDNQDKIDALTSGKPAGVLEDRFIRGPVEKHIIASVRALYPEYNNNFMDVHFSVVQMAKAVNQPGGEIATAKTPDYTEEGYRGEKYNLNIPSSVEGWTEKLKKPEKMELIESRGGISLIDQFTLAVMMAKSVGWNEKKIRNIGKDLEESHEADADTEVIISSVSPPGKIASAQLTAAFLVSKELRLRYYNSGSMLSPIISQLLRPFLKQNLENAVRLLGKKGTDMQVDPEAVSSFLAETSQISGGTLKPDTTTEIDESENQPSTALLEQTLVNMGREVAKAYKEAGIAVEQYMNRNNTDFDTPDLPSALGPIKLEFQAIATNKQKLLQEYGRIIKGYDRRIKKDKKEIKENMKTAISIGFGMVPGGEALIVKLMTEAGKDIGEQVLVEVVEDMIDEHDDSIFSSGAKIHLENGRRAWKGSMEDMKKIIENKLDNLEVEKEVRMRLRSEVYSDITKELRPFSPEI